MVKKEKALVLLDMDGVLCDLVSGVEYLYNTKFDFSDGSYHFYKKLGISQYELELDLNQSKFWTDLKPTPYLHEIFRILMKYKLFSRTLLCTQGVFRPEAHAGRLRWIQTYCHDFYQRKAYINIQDKSLLAGKDRILIDDYPKNCQKFMKAGGWAINFMADWNPLQKGNPVETMEMGLERILIEEEEDG
jgi:hypothetical protein